MIWYKEGGNMVILAGVGPMGLGMIDYAIHNEKKTKLLVVTDINEERLQRASKILWLKKKNICQINICKYSQRRR